MEIEAGAEPVAAGSTAAAAEELASRGLARSKLVGAILVLPRQVGPLKALLQQHGWLRPGRSICPWESPAPPSLEAAAAAAGSLMAVHVTAEAAAILSDPARHGEAPPVLVAALGSGEAVWQPGVRIGSPACGGPRGKQCDSAVYALREAVFSRPIWRPVIPPPRFRFAELFAGIGGFRLVSCRTPRLWHAWAQPAVLRASLRLLVRCPSVCGLSVVFGGTGPRGSRRAVRVCVRA
eukprot:COSAG06_NODE_10978_length_1587_cov_3.909274_2_plen_236_part_00